jgi:hypothetical protein
MNRTINAIAKQARTMTDAQLQSAYNTPRPAGVPASRHNNRCDVYMFELMARRDQRDAARLAAMAGDYAAIRAAYLEDGAQIFYDAMQALRPY